MATQGTNRFGVIVAVTGEPVSLWTTHLNVPAPKTVQKVWIAKKRQTGSDPRNSLCPSPHDIPQWYDMWGFFESIESNITLHLPDGFLRSKANYSLNSKYSHCKFFGYLNLWDVKALVRDEVFLSSLNPTGIGYITAIIDQWLNINCTDEKKL